MYLGNEYLLSNYYVPDTIVVLNNKGKQQLLGNLNVKQKLG